MALELLLAKTCLVGHQMIVDRSILMISKTQLGDELWVGHKALHTLVLLLLLLDRLSFNILLFSKVLSIRS